MQGFTSSAVSQGGGGVLGALSSAGKTPLWRLVGLIMMKQQCNQKQPLKERDKNNNTSVQSLCPLYLQGNEFNFPALIFINHVSLTGYYAWNVLDNSFSLYKLTQWPLLNKSLIKLSSGLQTLHLRPRCQPGYHQWKWSGHYQTRKTNRLTWTLNLTNKIYN